MWAAKLAHHFTRRPDASNSPSTDTRKFTNNTTTYPHNGASSRQTPTAQSRGAQLPSRAFRSSSSPCKEFIHLLRWTWQLTQHPIGTKRRLPTSPRIRSFRCRKEDANRRNTQRTIRSWCRKDQDRRARLPDHHEPQTRIQHRRFCISPRNHTFRCRKL